MTTVLIVDDHPMVLRYTQAEVAKIAPNAHVLVATSISEAETRVAEALPDYVLLDLTLPDCNGLSGLVRLRQLAPDAVVGIVSAETSPHVMRDCFLQGARGYLTKSTGADDFTAALLKLFENGFYYPPQASEPLPEEAVNHLTAREVEVLRAVALGKSNKQIAPMLGIAESSVKAHLKNIHKKLGVRTRLEAVRRGEELGLIDNRRRR